MRARKFCIILFYPFIQKKDQKKKKKKKSWILCLELLKKRYPIVCEFSANVGDDLSVCQYCGLLNKRMFELVPYPYFCYMINDHTLVSDASSVHMFVRTPIIMMHWIIQYIWFIDLRITLSSPFVFIVPFSFFFVPSHLNACYSELRNPNHLDMNNPLFCYQEN